MRMYRATLATRNCTGRVRTIVGLLALWRERTSFKRLVHAADIKIPLRAAAKLTRPGTHSRITRLSRSMARRAMNRKIPLKTLQLKTRQKRRCSYFLPCLATSLQPTLPACKSKTHARLIQQSAKSRSTVQMPRSPKAFFVPVAAASANSPRSRSQKSIFF